MENILLITRDEPLDPAFTRRVFQAQSVFYNLRFMDGDDAVDAIEAEFCDSDFHTIIHVNKAFRTISFSGTSDASLKAALIVQCALGVPLRMVDSCYTFDLMLDGFMTLDELKAAIEQAAT